MGTIILSIAVVILSVWVFLIERKADRHSEVICTLIKKTMTKKEKNIWKEVTEAIDITDSEDEAKKKIEKIVKKHGLNAEVEVIKKGKK